MSAPAAALLAAVAVSACGGARPAPPDLSRPLRPDGFVAVTLRSAQVRLSVPRNWVFSREHAPLVAVAVSGDAVSALWRYPSKAPPTAAPTPLGIDRGALLSAASAHGGLVRLLASRSATVAGQPAVVLDALERIGGRLRRVLSTHIYAPGAELVLEQYAPPSQFRRVRRQAFLPIVRSLALLSAGVP